MMKLFSTLDSRLCREFIRPIYFTRFDFFQQIPVDFTFRFEQNFETALAKHLICDYCVKADPIFRH